MASFLAGWLTGELAPHFIFWQALVLAFFVLWGSVGGFFGALGLLMCVGAWAAMAWYYYQSADADELTEAALAEGLGRNYRASIVPEASATFASKPDAQLLKHPFRRSDPEVELIRDLPFGDFGQKLDIRRSKQAPADGGEKRPVLMQIHGGGWTKNYGSKKDNAIPLMNYMAKQGWVCVSNAYRLCPKATFPEHIIDCKQALVWIKEHISEYGGDPDFIIVTGGSAGGHLSSLMALSANFATFQPGFENKDTSVQGAVSFYGVYDLADRHRFNHNDSLQRLTEDSMMKLDLANNTSLYDDASPLCHVNEKAPPFMLIHGDCDTLVPVELGRHFAESLAAASREPCVYLELPGAQHAFDMLPSVRSEYVKMGIGRFLAWLHSRYLKQQPKGTVTTGFGEKPNEKSSAKPSEKPNQKKPSEPKPDKTTLDETSFGNSGLDKKSEG